MDQELLAVVGNLATGYFVGFTSTKVKGFFDKVFRKKPTLADDLRRASSTQDVERVFREAVGVVDASAGSGTIDVDTAFLEALRGIRFDHENGRVTIQGATLKAPVLQTGGTGAGTTTIGEETVMKSQGTEIRVGKRCSITITGDASIRQT